MTVCYVVAAGMDHNNAYSQDLPYAPQNSPWPDPSGYHSQQQSPLHEYTAYAFPASHAPLQPVYHHLANIPRTVPQALQPLTTPAGGWPSAYTGQSSFPQDNLPIQPQLQPAPSLAFPQSTQNSATHHTPTPRKTLTDADRRRMCIYHEQNPTKKQTEIGDIFGVERSTVSKVLRQKDKYLYQDDGSRSPIRKSKGKFPDIDRALTVWVKNQQSSGVPLTDEAIKKQALFFSSTVGESDTLNKISTTSWLEKFKQKNNLSGQRSRKGSMTPQEDGAHSPIESEMQDLVATSLSRTTSPISGVLPAKESHDSLVGESTERQNPRGPTHSQSSVSLSSAYTDTRSPSLSTTATNPSLPLYSPDLSAGSGSFFPTQSLHYSPASLNAIAVQRQRSQTYPTANTADQLTSPPPPSTAAPTPIYTPTSLLDSPIPEMPPPPSTVHRSAQNSPVQPASYPGHEPNSSPATPDLPSQDDAHRALEVVMRFFQAQPPGATIAMDQQESMTVGKLMERLRLRLPGPRRGDAACEQLPGGLHRIPEHEFALKRSANGGAK